MRRLISASSLLLLFTSALFAHADTIETFNLNGTLAIGTVQGTVTIDTTTGRITNSDFDVTAGPFTFDFSGGPTTQSAIGSEYGATFFSINYSLDIFRLDLPVSTLTAYDGSIICNSSCPYGGSFFDVDIIGFDPLKSGAVAATPEPSSLMLLGTGVLGVAGVLRRRFAAKS